MNSPINLAVLISGSGSTMDSVLDAVQNGSLKNVKPVVVISSEPEAAGLNKASARGTPTAVIQRKSFSTSSEFGKELLRTLKQHGADHIAQLGWLPLTPKNVIQEFENNIFNQHPGPLDPGREDFGGRGMFGIHVHAAVLAYQWLTSERFPTEATTHLVTEEFDRGKIISSAPLDTEIMEANVTPEFFEDKIHLDILAAAAGALQKKLLPLEHQNVIKTIQLLADDNVSFFTRTKPLIPKQSHDMLGYAKKIAAQIT